MSLRSQSGHCRHRHHHRLRVGLRHVDSYGDIVAKGAFRKTIADAKSNTGSWPAMLLQHGDETAQGKTPIGIWTDMAEDEHGLRLTGKLANTKRGLDAYALLQEGQ